MKAATPDTLVNMAGYRHEKRVNACGGIDPIRIHVAYAQADATDPLDTAKKLNNFGHAYRTGSQLFLQKPWADIVIDAAIELQQTHGWQTELLDGLRTVDAQIAIREAINQKRADPAWYEKGMLSNPGKGAHPKGLAVDIRHVKDGREIKMGSPFDEIENTALAGREYPHNADIKENLRRQEQAFLKAAFKHGQLLYALPHEHWHYQLPEDPGDWWNTLWLAHRVMGDAVTVQEIKALGIQTADNFAAAWQKAFAGREAEMKQKLGNEFTLPDLSQVHGHGEFKLISERDLETIGLSEACQTNGEYRKETNQICVAQTPPTGANPALKQR